MSGIRKFKSGATRDIADGKIEYYGFRHPLLEHSFGKYMHKHRLQSNGEMRDSNNWWAGWDKIISLQSMNRHLEDLNAINAGLVVVKIRENGEERTEYLPQTDIGEYVISSITTKKGAKVERISAEDCLNAIRFNTQSYLLEEFKKENA